MKYSNLHSGKSCKKLIWICKIQIFTIIIQILVYQASNVQIQLKNSIKNVNKYYYFTNNQIQSNNFKQNKLSLVSINNNSTSKSIKYPTTQSNHNRQIFQYCCYERKKHIQITKQQKNQFNNTKIRMKKWINFICKYLNIELKIQIDQHYLYFRKLLFLDQASQQFQLFMKQKKYNSFVVGNQISITNLLKRYQSQQLQIFRKINKNQIFDKVFNFIKYIIENEKQLNQFIDELNFQNEKEVEQSNQIQIESTKQNLKPFPIHPNVIQNYQQATQSKINKNLKKISIITPEILNDNDLSPWMSQQSLKSISTLPLPYKKLNLELIKDIYEKPEAFLINLSVCLLLKFVKYSKIKLSQQNVGWILAISTIIAYKIYYDEPVQGLVESFKYILGIRRQDIIDIQICFLNEIEHRAIISSYQYHLVLCKIIIS